MMLLKLFALFLCVHFGNTAKILCFFPFPSYSHQVTFQPIWRELALRGHDVTVVTPNPLKESIKNLREIDMHDISYAVMDKYNISSFGVNDEVDSTDLSAFMDSAKELIRVQMEDAQVKEIIVNKKGVKYDLLVVELSLLHGFMLKDVYEVPMVAITSMPLHYNGDEVFGNQNHPIVCPDLNLPFSRNLSFFERVQSVSQNLLVRLMYYTMMSVFAEGIKQGFGREFREEIMYETSLVLTNVNPVLHPRKPTVPNVIEFSGIHIHEPRKLPNDLQKYMDDSKQGIIYMSLGSNIKSTALGERKIKIILETFAQLPYNILWKFEAEDLPNRPKNVRIQKWFPQQDVLRHPNVKLFITQGGLQSLDEAMDTKTPVVCIPFFGDQYGNARKVNDIGMGLSIQNSKITTDSFKAVISEALSERFAKRAVELYDIVTDQPMPALNKTIYWIEYVLRHKDLSHLKTAALSLPFYQYFMLDVAAFFALIFAVVVYVIKLLFGVLCRCLCKRRKQKTN